MADRRVIEDFTPHVAARDWGEEIIIAHEPGKYLGKLLRMKAGTKGGLQYHVEKVETFYLHEGRAWVRYADSQNQLQQRMIFPGASIHVPAGAVHQVEAIDDCVFFEASTPHFADRVRVEEQYGLVQDGGLPTTR